MSVNIMWLGWLINLRNLSGSFKHVVVVETSLMAAKIVQAVDGSRRGSNSRRNFFDK